MLKADMDDRVRPLADQQRYAREWSVVHCGKPKCKTDTRLRTVADSLLWLSEKSWNIIGPSVSASLYQI